MLLALLQPLYYDVEIFVKAGRGFFLLLFMLYFLETYSFLFISFIAIRASSVCAIKMLEMKYLGAYRNFPVMKEKYRILSNS